MNSNELDALFTGLTGTATKEGVTASKPATTAVIASKDKKPAVGKERTRQKRHEKERQEERFCTIVSSDVLKKIRTIAAREGMQIKDVIEAALVKAIGGYEQKHGVIEEDTKRKAIDLF